MIFRPSHGDRSHRHGRRPEADYNWRVKLPGGGHSSPVLWGDRIFLSSADAVNFSLLCVDEKDGRLRWKKDYPHGEYALHKFSSVGKPMRRFAYAVNEQLYKPPERKAYDVAFLCWPTDERRRIERQVRDICYKRGYSYLTGTWDNPYEYAHQVGRAKVVVHYAHVKRARSWRVFDVMACQGALLTSVLPIVDGDGIEPGRHYWEYTDDLEEQLVGLVSTGCWERIARTGYEHVMAHHTWATRATELRKTLNEALGL